MLVTADTGRDAGVFPAARAHALDTLACIVGAHADPLFRARAGLYEGRLDDARGDPERPLSSAIGNGIPT